MQSTFEANDLTKVAIHRRLKSFQHSFYIFAVIIALGLQLFDKHFSFFASKRLSVVLVVDALDNREMLFR